MDRTELPHPARVVVAIDSHTSASRAVDWAAETARAQGSPLEVWHCWRAPAEATSPPGGAVLPVVSLGRPPSAAAKALVDVAVSRVGRIAPTVQVHGRLLEGWPAATVLGELQPGDLLVLGLHSTHRTAARLLGSTASWLIGRAPCPVTALPLGTPEFTGPFAGHVVVAVNDSPGAGEAVRLGFAEAAARGWPLAAVHAYQPAEFGSYIDENTLETQLAPYPASYRLLQAAIEPWHQRYPTVPVRRSCLSGSPVQALTRAAAGARLLVMGRHQRPWLMQPPVRLVDQLLAKVACPVLVTAPMPSQTEVAGQTTSAAIPAPRQSLRDHASH